MTRSLPESSFLILTALASGPLHGYAITTETQRMSDGDVVLRAGTLYTALDRLSNDGLVEIDREEVVDSRLRRYYRLTAAGVTALTEASQARAALARTAQQRLKALRVSGATS